MTAAPDIDDSLAAAGVFRALSDPFRLHIYVVVRRMCAEAAGSDGAVPLSEVIDRVAEALNMSPSLAEQHLMELARSQLILLDDGPEGRPAARMNAELLHRVAGVVGGSA